MLDPCHAQKTARSLRLRLGFWRRRQGQGAVEDGQALKDFGGSFLGAWKISIK